MDLLRALSCNDCTSLYPKPPLHRRPFFSTSISLSLRTTSELRSQVAVTGQNGTSYSLAVPTHKVTVHDRQRGVVHEFFVPEDQYILHTAESQNINLPLPVGTEIWSFPRTDPSSLLYSQFATQNIVNVKCNTLYCEPLDSCLFGAWGSDLSALSFRNNVWSGLRSCCTSCAVRVKSGQLRQPEALGISAELKSKGYALLCVGFPSSDLEVETQDEDEVYWLQFGRYFARGPIDRDDYALELAMGDE
ncbi:unnamed protein product [Fraxinus pennsylvanica]|uniref:Ferredoxin n=1 Tax=Fraxinus pennsylvanica TaxID=56036 RepID=A0AAD2E0E5_9LAMI|nr:unnamed protein product [Fraxinus pennsylvanica]